MSLSIRLLDDKLLVKQDEAPDETEGGIALPNQAKERPARGAVMAIGDGRVFDNGTVLPMRVSVGDKVLFTVYGGSSVEIDGEDYLILTEMDVLAIVG